MKNSFKEIRNIIFDLGGVIINLDMERTHQALLQLAGQAEVPLFNYTTQHDIFKRFEVGGMDSQAFLNGLGELIGNGNHEALTLAWNAMLLDIPAERIALLKELKQQYRTFLFSNTNQIHYDGFNQILQTDHGLPGLEPLFERVYFSHTMGMRKPDVESFKHIIAENGLIPEETLFLDDTAGHLEGAKAAGLQTILVSSENHLLEIFSKLAST